MIRRYCSRAVVLLGLALTGCVINPVTGDRELALVSADQEIAKHRATTVQCRTQLRTARSLQRDP